MNQKIQQLMQDKNDVNVLLAGCLPALVQLPVVYGLYKAISNLAKEDKLNEAFLWLPNLEGPVYGADPSSASSWLFSGWVDGVPPLGWDDTLAFLAIPVILIISQVISFQLITPKEQEQPAFFKFIPLVIGFASISVPAALGLYWIFNNIVTTLLTIQIRSSVGAITPIVNGESATAATSSAVIDTQPTTFTPAPMREKPAGFGATDWSDAEDSIKPITPIDAVIEESGETVEAAASASVVENTAPKRKKRGKKKRKKN